MQSTITARSKIPWHVCEQCRAPAFTPWKCWRKDRFVQHRKWRVVVPGEVTVERIERMIDELRSAGYEDEANRLQFSLKLHAHIAEHVGPPREGKVMIADPIVSGKTQDEMLQLYREAGDPVNPPAQGDPPVVAHRLVQRAFHAKQPSDNHTAKG